MTEGVPDSARHVMSTTLVQPAFPPPFVRLENKEEEGRKRTPRPTSQVVAPSKLTIARIQYTCTEITMKVLKYSNNGPYMRFFCLIRMDSRFYMYCRSK